MPDDSLDNPSYELLSIPSLVQANISLLSGDQDFLRSLPLDLYDSGCGVLMGALALKRQLPRESLHLYIQNSIGRFGDKSLHQIAAVVRRDLQHLSGGKAAAFLCNSACAAIRACAT